MAFDHELKLDRAFKHLQDFDGQAQIWADGNHHSVRYVHDPDACWLGPIPPGNAIPGAATMYLARRVFMVGQEPDFDVLRFGQGVLTAYASAEQPPPDPFGLFIGDALHNLRSALDALAYALAAAFTRPLPEDIANSSEFPIIGDEDWKGTPGVGHTRFHTTKRKTGEPAFGSGLFKIRGCDPRVKTIIEGLQPYQRGQDFRSDPLWILNELDRINKHRILHTTVTGFFGVGLDTRGFVNLRSIGPGLIQSLSGSIETDTPIGRVYGVNAIDPSADVHMKIDPTIVITFGPEAPIASGTPVSVALAEIYAYIATNVMAPLSGFLV